MHAVKAISAGSWAAVKHFCATLITIAAVLEGVREGRNEVSEIRPDDVKYPC